MTLRIVGAAALLLAGLSACGSEEGQAGPALCLGVNALESTASAVIDEASSTITVGDAEQALTALSAAYDRLASDIRQAAPSVSQQFEEAEVALRNALSDVGESTTLDQAGEQVDEARQNLRATYRELLEAMGC